MQFTKTPLDIPSQVAWLKTKGLIIGNQQIAERYLSNISLYRLKVYSYPFKASDGNFTLGTSFSDIVNLYTFDKQLRQLLFDAIEHIEVALRAQLANCLAMAHGTHWYMASQIFASFEEYVNTQSQIIRECRGKTSTSINHYNRKYTNPQLPPAWMVMEVLTLGQLSRLYKALASSREKQNIANHFGVKDTVLASWLHSLSYLRNACAHHSRIWNQSSSVVPVLPNKTASLWLSHPPTNPQRIYTLLAVIVYLLRRIDPTQSFKDRALALINAQSTSLSAYREMGFPLSWQNDVFWH